MDFHVSQFCFLVPTKGIYSASQKNLLFSKTRLISSYMLARRRQNWKDSTSQTSSCRRALLNIIFRNFRKTAEFVAWWLWMPFNKTEFNNPWKLCSITLLDVRQNHCITYQMKDTNDCESKMADANKQHRNPKTPDYCQNTDLEHRKHRLIQTN